MWRSMQSVDILSSQRSSAIGLKADCYVSSDWLVDYCRFVSRANATDPTRHVILGSQEFRPTDFAKQMNFQMDNAWGILRCVIDYFMKCDPGIYLMMKNPNKVSAAYSSRIYGKRAPSTQLPLLQWSSCHTYSFGFNPHPSTTQRAKYRRKALCFRVFWGVWIDSWTTMVQKVLRTHPTPISL